jgi:hypothetical protein
MELFLESQVSFLNSFLKTIKTQDEAASQFRERRSKINALYEKGTPNRSLAIQAYFDRKDLWRGETSGNTIAKAEPLPEDPYAMGCFFPDRIVECILVPDERQRFLSTAVHISLDISEVAATGKNSVRIFLKRRILTEAYNPALPIYICVDCGRRFLSLAGMRYQCSAKVCVESNIKESEKRTKSQAKVEVVRQQIHQSSHARKSNCRDRKKKVKAPRAMYPKVLISLGFQLVKHDMHFSSLESLPLVNSTDRIVGYSDEKF